MAARILTSPPSMMPLYGRSALAMLPGAALLPFVPGAGKEIPELELTLTALTAQADEVAAYAKVCGFSPREELPVTYPHVLAFPLHMAIMADGSFPFGAVGLVHIENRIVQRRAIQTGEELEIRVRPTPLEDHPRGLAFSLLSKVLSDGEPVWEEVSRFLRRGPGGGAGASAGERATLEPTAEWHLAGDLGRRYAAVSQDRNPIHMHALTAKALGFPKAIAHGMWAKARCLAALDARLPDAFAVEVSFRKPILLPGTVRFESAREGAEIDFAVSDAKGGPPHLQGRARPLDGGRDAR